LFSITGITCEQVPGASLERPAGSRTTDGGVFGPLGVISIRTVTDPQNPNRVAVLLDVADLDTVAASQ
jgi:hypothetical protein